MLIIGLYPVIYSIGLSLSEFSINTPEVNLVGLHNYVSVLQDSAFWSAVRVTILYVVGSVISEFFIGLLLALILIGNIRGKSFFYISLIIPLATAPILMGTLASPTGFWDDLNTGLYYGSGLGIFIDLFQPLVYYSVIILSDAWLWSPLFMLIFLAIIQAIPREIYEAAEISGASKWQVFKKITFQSVLRSKVTAFVLSLRVVDAFRAFEIPYAWTFWLGQEQLGGPVDTLSVLMWKLFTTSAYEFPIARIATISILMLIITMTFAVLTLRLGGKDFD
jgi:multiple sugar transport system permease protein